jgi:mannose-6-phosphate isomerase-like protein (cupin superfamily)
MAAIYSDNVDNNTLKNKNYRNVVYTHENGIQFVLMNLKKRDDEIGMERHDKSDQFIKIESGKGIAIIEKDGVIQNYDLLKGSAIIIPSGTNHNIKNTGNEPLKLYTIYTLPEHKDQLVQKNKLGENKQTSSKKGQKGKKAPKEGAGAEEAGSEEAIQPESSGKKAKKFADAAAAAAATGASSASAAASSALGVVGKQANMLTRNVPSMKTIATMANKVPLPPQLAMAKFAGSKLLKVAGNVPLPPQLALARKVAKKVAKKAATAAGQDGGYLHKYMKYKMKYLNLLNELNNKFSNNLV